MKQRLRNLRPEIFLTRKVESGGEKKALTFQAVFLELFPGILYEWRELTGSGSEIMLRTSD